MQADEAQRIPTVPSVTSAATVTLALYGDLIDITGAAGITSITAARPVGRSLLFNGGLITHV